MRFGQNWLLTRSKKSVVGDNLEHDAANRFVPSGVHLKITVSIDLEWCEPGYKPTHRADYPARYYRVRWLGLWRFRANSDRTAARRITQSSK